MHLTLQAISKHFGPLKANDNISFSFESGRIYAIVGENGAGKSTLMKILSGYQTPTSGHIIIDKHPIELNSPNQAITHGIGMLYQDPLDFAPLTVLENYINGRAGGLFLGRRAALTDLQARCQQMGFKLNPHALVETLTVGERQQLEIVRLLSLGVKFLILDEPTTGISAEQKAQLFDTLKRLAQDQALTVVLVSHKLEDIAELCDEALVLRRGELVGHQILPCPTETIVELMFGKRIAGVSPEKVELGDPILHVSHYPVHTPLFSIPAIDLDVQAGEVIGLAGLDGSGQVEFMRGLAGLNRPTWADHIFSLLSIAALIFVFNELLKESQPVLQLAIISASALIMGPLTALAMFFIGSPQILENIFDTLLPDALATPLNGLLEITLIKTPYTVLVAVVLIISTLFRLFPITKWLRQSWQQAAGNVHTPQAILAQRNITEYGYRDLMTKGLAYLPAGRIEEGLVSGLTVTAHVVLAERTFVPWVNWFGAWRRAKTLIQTYRVKGRALDPIQNLSGGNQQRVAVGLLPPKLRLILLDNPTRGLDVESAQHIWALLLSRRTQGTSIIFSSPDLDEIIDYSNRILVFSSGRVTLVDDASHMTTARLGELIGGKQ